MEDYGVKLTENGRPLFDLLMQIPPDLETARTKLESGGYSGEDLGRAACRYAEECWDEELDHRQYEDEIGDYLWAPPVLKPELHSAYLYQVTELLLAYGLDPNAEYDGVSILYECCRIVNEYVGADTARLLLEHGADPNKTLRDGENQFADLDFDVWFAAFNQYDRRRFDANVHCWLVMVSFGAKLLNGKSPVDIYETYDVPFKLEDLRDHRNYTFGLSYVPSHGEKWSLHVFDKRTCWEVART